MSTRRARLAALVVGAILPLVTARSGGADDAEVLPKGISNVSLGIFSYFVITDRFNKHGDTEPVANAFENRRLDSSVFPLLSGVDLFVPGGSASIGDANVTFRYHYNILNFGYAYGITDRLSAGIEIPYYHVHNDVKAALDSGPGSSANVGINTTCGGAGGPNPVLPLGPGNVRRFTTEDVQQLLGSGLGAGTGTGSCFVQGFGFKPVKNFTDDGLGDIAAAFKYQYLRTEDWRLAASLGARFPTGRQDDPDDLSDIPWSAGNYAILLRLHNDYVLSNLWREGKPALTASGPIVPRTGDLIVDFTFRYDWNLSTDVTVRVSDASNPVTTNKERVSRKYGDKFELELAGKYYLLKGLSLALLYRYGFKLEDVVRGRRFDTRPLEEDTDSNEHLYIVGANYSLLPLYREKRFPIPLTLSLTYRDRFAGRGPSNAASPSQILRSQYINFTLSVPF